MTEADFLRATRASYDAVAPSYAPWVRDELDVRPLERGLMGCFAELVQAAGPAPVADVGCGTGRITAFLAGLGADAFGIDLSPQMVAQARAAYPELRFDVGSMLSLDLPDASLGGVLAWYSTIHVPDAELPAAWAEFHRVLAPGGYLLTGFQVGDHVLHRTEARGQPVTLDFHHRRPEQVAALLAAAGFAPYARLQRERDETGQWPERSAQGFVLARKPGGPSCVSYAPPGGRPQPPTPKHR
jgi:SAM-dependent methyltransferase